MCWRKVHSEVSGPPAQGDPEPATATDPSVGKGIDACRNQSGLTSLGTPAPAPVSWSERHSTQGFRSQDPHWSLIPVKATGHLTPWSVLQPPR